MQRIILLIILILTIAFSIGCQNTTNQAYQRISPEKAYERLQNEKDIILLDVRTLEEYQEKHIPGSLLVPVDELQGRIEDVIKDKNSTIFIYCRSGNRSAQAAKILVGLGYTKVYDLGGINSWKYEVVK